MAKHVINSEQVFRFGLGTESVNIIPDAGASYTVSYESSIGFTDDDAGAQTVPNRVFVQNTVVKITPTGGFVTITGPGTF